MNESLLEVWGVGLGESFQTLGTGFAGFLLEIIAALVIVLAGWAVGAVLGRVTAQIVKSLKFDKVLQSAGAEDIIARAGFHLNSGAFLGGLVKWFIIVTFLVAAFDVLGLTQVNVFLREVVLGYLPQVIVAVLILLIGAVLADSMQKVVTGSAKAAEIVSANLLGAVTRWSIWIFAILIALSHLGIAPQFMFTLFTAFVAMLALAGGLAFGLGGRDAAEKYIDKIKRDISSTRN
jgi:small-conductance mechanosensitive channel